MSKYNGSKCMACGRIFFEGDDVVVCAECGTPYHRECYAANGRCINDALHQSGGEWIPDIAAEKKTEDAAKKLTCESCGAENPAGAVFCDSCGAPLISGSRTGEQEPRFGDPFCGMSPDEDFEGAKLSEIAAFVGGNTYYYLPIFSYFKRMKKRFSWNLSAMLFPPLYFFYRKMYGWGVLTIIISLLTNIPAAISMMVAYNIDAGALNGWLSTIDIRSPEFSTIYNITLIISYIYLFLRSAFANWLYYRHVLKSVNAIKKQASSDGEALEAMRSKGGVSPLSLLILVGISTALSASLGVLLGG